MKNIIHLHLVLVLITGFLSVSEKSTAQNVTIIESKSYAPWAVMDSIWLNATTQLGYNAKIVQQSALYNIDSLANTDVLIVSSAVIGFTQPSQLQTIIAFVKSGRPAYIQSEYLSTYQGDSTFLTLMDTLKENFKWTTQVSGDIEPMKILSPFSQYPDTVSFINYFNYGQAGTGGAHIDTFLEYQGNYFGFYYLDTASCNGAVVTCSDEDWIYPNDCPSLLVNILYRLVHSKNCTTATSGIANVKETIGVYPNPFTDYIVCNVPDNMTRIDIINEIGQVVSTKIITGSNNKNQTIDTRNISPGLYILRASGNSSAFVKKIIKIE